MLNVTTKTVRNWENGSSTIPYSAFRLMRLFGGYALVGKQWEGWSIYKGALYSPAGRAFEPYQLLYLSNYLWMAKQWLKERAEAKASKKQNLATVEIETSASDAPSRATARLGAQGHRNLMLRGAGVASLQEKTFSSAKPEKYRKFTGIAEAAKDALEWEAQ